MAKVDPDPLLAPREHVMAADARASSFDTTKFRHDPHRGTIAPCCHCGPKVLFNNQEPRISKGIIFVKWAGPAALWVFSMFICMWLLHIATYMYVRSMDRFEATYEVKWQPGDAKPAGMTDAKLKWLNATDHLLSPGIDHHSEVSYGSLEDPLEGYLGWTSINLKTLDMISAAIPGTWWVFTLYTRDLQMWTKAIVANSLLAIWKGLFGAMTIVPDSIGWESCKARLGDVNLKYMRDAVPKPEEKGYLAMAWALFKNEIWGHGVGYRPGAGMRFCADMMYSGHTYFTTLYALALFEMVRSHVEKGPMRGIIVALIFLLCVGEQVIEATFVIQDRFHYTMDVVMAVLLAFLWHTNASIIIVARKWAHWDGTMHIPFFHAHAPNDGHHYEISKKEREFMEQPWYKEHFHKGTDFRVIDMSRVNHSGDLEVPECFVPFCCCAGRHHLLREEHVMHPALQGLDRQ